jgi:2-(1,2-epoxy-1,2-dihydrophenyl)acetyl-CoA isomerase
MDKSSSEQNLATLETPDDESFLVERSGGVLRLMFNRPEFGNSVPAQSVPALIAVFEAAQDEPAVRCILISANGKVFSAGGDVAGFAKTLEQDRTVRQADFTRRLGLVARLVEAVCAFDRPIIVAMPGAAAGAGLLYPLAADLVLGDVNAAFVFAHQRVGLSPDGGVTSLLPLTVGVRTARMLLLTAAKVDAAEAQRLGLLHRMVPTESLEAESMKLARNFAAAPQLAISAAKRLINTGWRDTLAAQLEAEAKHIVACVGDQDFAEGVGAFIEKRKARFPSAQM